MTDEETNMPDNKIDAFFSKLRRLNVEARVDNNTDWMNYDKRAERRGEQSDARASGRE